MGTLSLGGYRPTRTWVRSYYDRPAGPPSAPELEQGYGWRTGHRAGALYVLFMLATGTGVAELLSEVYTKSPETQAGTTASDRRSRVRYGMMSELLHHLLSRDPSLSP